MPPEPSHLFSILLHAKKKKKKKKKTTDGSAEKFVYTRRLGRKPAKVLVYQLKARFERYAGQVGWKREQWSLYLSALLKSKALEVYSRLPTDEAQNYDF